MENKSIYHYTSSLGLLGIIKDQAIRCTNLKFLNDRTEYTYFFKEYINYIQREVENLITKSNDTNVESAFKTGYNTFKHFMTSNVKNTYVACFTTNKDSIPNWMAYGKSTINYCIEFSSTEVDSEVNDNRMGKCNKESSDNLLNYYVPTTKLVSYGTNDIIFNELSFLKFVNDVIIKIAESPENNDVFEQVITQLYNKIALNCSSTKNIEWEHENEYRIILSERAKFDGEKVLRNEEESKFISWRDSNGILIPFVNFPINRRLIKSVTYLAQHNPERVEESLNLLKSLYDLDFEIIKSECSLVL